MESIHKLGKRLGVPELVVRIVKSIATVVLYAAMLIAILALWNNDAPQFIYVAF